MSKWNLIIDVDLCCNCGNCSLAIKDEYVGNTFPGYAASQPLHGSEWFRVDRHVRGEGTHVDVTYIPKTCNHCDDAPCLKKGEGAVKKRDDGIVIIDEIAAKGRKDLVSACPYGAICWNDELQLPQSWPFDAHLIDAGSQEPRPAQVCPTGAVRAVKVDDAERDRMIQAQCLEVLRPEFGTQPRVFYRGLQRLRTVCVAGNVSALREGGMHENVEGAEVELQLSGGEAHGARTDAFGDFRIDGLTPTGEGYRLTVQYPNTGRAIAEGVLESSDVLELKLT